MIRKALTAALLCCTPVACGGDAGPSPEQIESRDIAARQACISERLATRAMDELQTLEQLMGSAGIVAFQRAYEQHASLRLAAFAQLDSALNHSATAEDSIRHDGAARRIQIRAPAAESVEDNVLRSYEANFAAIFNDSDHPCNWQSELDSRD